MVATNKTWFLILADVQMLSLKAMMAAVRSWFSLIWPATCNAHPSKLHIYLYTVKKNALKTDWLESEEYFKANQV